MNPLQGSCSEKATPRDSNNCSDVKMISPSIWCRHFMQVARLSQTKGIFLGIQTFTGIDPDILILVLHSSELAQAAYRLFTAYLSCCSARMAKFTLFLEYDRFPAIKRLF